MSIADPAGPAPNGGSLAPLVASLYDAAPQPMRVRLLARLLRPVGPLALAAIAAGAFARLLPRDHWAAVIPTLDDVASISADHVFELTRYIEQKSPELLGQIPELLGERAVGVASVGGSLLLALHAWRALHAARPASGTATAGDGEP
jgi:hypothetical protein